ncbi:hypothetical protein BDQ17DRAFT_293878 [Cyathus striatus]|nr:hypothetical protein BDQ17DRAFT_293878 [Cyathus striatus]
MYNFLRGVRHRIHIWYKPAFNRDMKYLLAIETVLDCSHSPSAVPRISSVFTTFLDRSSTACLTLVLCRKPAAESHPNIVTFGKSYPDVIYHRFSPALPNLYVAAFSLRRIIPLATFTLRTYSVSGALDIVKTRSFRSGIPVFILVEAPFRFARSST